MQYSFRAGLIFRRRGATLTFCERRPEMIFRAFVIAGLAAVTLAAPGQAQIPRYESDRGSGYETRSQTGGQVGGQNDGMRNGARPALGPYDRPTLGDSQPRVWGKKPTLGDSRPYRNTSPARCTGLLCD